MAATRPDRSLRHSTFDLNSVDGACPEPVFREVFAVHEQIFAGLDESGFRREVLERDAEWSQLRVYRDSDGRVVGYAAIHRFRRVGAGELVTVFRAEAGLLPEYRTHGVTFYFYLLALLKYRIAHPLRTIFYLGTLVHPSSYVVFARHFETVFPHRRVALDAPTEHLMLELADAFHAPAVDASDPMIRQVGWITRVERAYWRRSDDPDVVFFRERNPGYAQGHGLVVLVPITFRNLVLSMLGYARGRSPSRSSSVNG